MPYLAAFLTLLSFQPAYAARSRAETRMTDRTEARAAPRAGRLGPIDLQAEETLSAAELDEPLSLEPDANERRLQGTERERAVERRAEVSLRQGAKQIELGKERGTPEPVLRQIFEGFDAGKFERYRAPIVPKGEIVDLTAIDPGDTGDVGRKKAERAARRDQLKLKKLQNKFYYDGRFMMLAVKNGMDTAGKDSSINHVLHWMNKQGFVPKSFKEPTEIERSHHFLWRVRRALINMSKGLIALFNRSHYEDVVVPFMFPESFAAMTAADIDRRIDEIRAFERELARQGYVILKFFYHISRPEQKTRLEERRDGPKRKQVKLSKADLKNRERWDRAMHIWGKLLAETNESWAPWYIIPADVEWFRDYATGRIWVKRLKSLGLKYPDVDPDLLKREIPD